VINNIRILRQLDKIMLATLTLILTGCGTQPQTDSAQVLPKRPNILLIVADDMAYTDLGAFGGGDIKVPTLDKLAQEGLVFSRFYAGAQCSATRSMLLTGLDNHQAGMGTTVGAYSQPAPNQKGQPGYEGEIRSDVLTVSSLLQDAGYYTTMVGKWHLGASQSNRPINRGFNNTFAIQQNTDYFNDQLGSFGFGHRDYWRNGEVISDLPKDFYQTRAFTDEFIDGLKQRDDASPFFGYLAYTAPHYPLQAPDDIIDKYKGSYDEGYDVLRAKRSKALLSSGLINAKAHYSNQRDDVQPWDSLTLEEKQTSARSMEIYAAMVDEMDSNIARVIDYLKDNDLYENTLIIFLSDNGAEAASKLRGHAPALLPKAKNLDNSLENMGRKGSVVLYSHTWAAAGEGVFREYKFSGAEGGVRVPAIMSWPNGPIKPGINHGVTSVLDFLPTVLELAGVEHPASTDSTTVYKKPIGKSLLPVLQGKQQSVRTEKDYLGFEFWGGRGIVSNDWKLTGLYNQHKSALEDWQLFNLANDPGEQVDLSVSEPEKMQQMMGYWQDYVKSNGVIIAKPDVPALRMP
jgi:arylsulfatase A-like enzyme